MRKGKLFIVLLGLLLSLTSYLNAQPGGDPGGGGNPTPITGIEILLALGGIFGVKKIIGVRRKK